MCVCFLLLRLIKCYSAQTADCSGKYDQGMKRRTVLLMAVLLAALPAGAANDGPMERATLKGLKSINVVIDTLSPVLIHDGLAAETLRAQIEHDLSAAGITVDRNAREFVGLRITHVRAAKGPYAFGMSLGFYQPVVLSRDKDIRTVTQTWEVISVAMAEPKVLIQAANDTASELTQRFVSAWRSVNAKQ